MATLKFIGTVRTNKVGSACSFEFEVDTDDLPEDPHEREKVIEERATDALWESGQVEWGWEQTGEEP